MPSDSGKLTSGARAMEQGPYIVGRMQAMADTTKAAVRVLVVEDEYLIRMLLEDMLADLGYEVAAAVGTIAEASDVAANAQFDVAILDVNVDGKEIYPVADILAKRGLPFVFVTGYGEGSLRQPIAAARRCRNRSRPNSSRPRSPDCSLNPERPPAWS